MAILKLLIISLSLISCSLALPTNRDVAERKRHLDGTSGVTEESSIVLKELSSLSSTDAVALDKLASSTVAADTEDRTFLSQRYVQKRAVEEPESEDLEVAAGTNVLRPLFVYRQQVAYRQRVKNGGRRRYRFRSE